MQQRVAAGVGGILSYLYSMQGQPIIVFDGVCNLCNGFVKLVFAADKNATFKFASLQSGAAQNLLNGHGDFKKLNSVVLVADGTIYQKSTAVLKVLRQLPWYWQWTQVFWLVPRSLRDAVYNWIARNRYKWFGKKETCMMPSADLQKRFLN